MGSAAKTYMMKGFLFYEEIFFIYVGVRPEIHQAPKDARLPNGNIIKFSYRRERITILDITVLFSRDTHNLNYSLRHNLELIIRNFSIRKIYMFYRIPQILINKNKFFPRFLAKRRCSSINLL
jgi:hypothetical protein